MPAVGDLGPDFALYNQDQHMVQLGRLTADADHVVVYFFPQAGAPGCVREAIGFRDVMPELLKRRVRVVGITSSPGAEITAFAKEQGLNFDVLCDSSRRICEEWGALRGENTARMTFILNAKGVVTHAFPRVDVWKHGRSVGAVCGEPGCGRTCCCGASSGTASGQPDGGGGLFDIGSQRGTGSGGGSGARGAEAFADAQAVGGNDSSRCERASDAAGSQVAIAVERAALRFGPAVTALRESCGRHARCESDSRAS